MDVKYPRLKIMREARRMTQGELGQCIGITKQTVSNYETGARTPSLKTLMALATYYDVSVDYLLGRTDIVIIKEVETQYRR